MLISLSVSKGRRKQNETTSSIKILGHSFKKTVSFTHSSYRAKCCKNMFHKPLCSSVSSSLRGWHILELFPAQCWEVLSLTDMSCCKAEHHAELISTESRQGHCRANLSPQHLNPVCGPTTFVTQLLVSWQVTSDHCQVEPAEFVSKFATNP